MSFPIVKGRDPGGVPVEGNGGTISFTTTLRSPDKDNIIFEQSVNDPGCRQNSTYALHPAIRRTDFMHASVTAVDWRQYDGFAQFRGRSSSPPRVDGIFIDDASFDVSITDTQVPQGASKTSNCPPSNPATASQLTIPVANANEQSVKEVVEAFKTFVAQAADCRAKGASAGNEVGP
ncbi:MAG TPA: hypothetical protein VGG39_37610 [Polyangiaceae bacterium]